MRTIVMFEGVVIVIATIISISASLVNKRFQVLALSLTCHAMFVYFWLHTGEMTALYMTIAAFIGTFIQLSTPEKYLQITMPLRVLSVVLLGAICFKISYVNPTDILAFLAFLNSRLSETLKKCINIQIGYVFSSVLWLSFALSSGDWITIASFVALFIVQAGALFYKFGYIDRYVLAYCSIKKKT